MLSLNLSQADVDTVNIERKNNSSALVRDRMNILYLLNLGFSRSLSALIVGCHPNSVTNYIKMYNSGGLKRIRELNYSIDRHELRDQYDQVDQALVQSNCSTVREAGQLLANQFAYHRSEEAVRKLLHRLGFKRRKTGTFPGKVKDLDKWQAQQETFIEKMDQLIREADNEQIDLLFGDAAHFVYGKFNAYCWSKAPRYAPSGHGRYRINVYGVYDLAINGIYTMYNEGYIDAEFMVQYFEWLRRKVYTNLERPIHLILDNARYQHCQLVIQKADKLNIVLEFLPSYSPNLNLIERLWKYLKKQLGQQYHQSKTSFRNTIVDLLQSLGLEEHQSKIRTLMNPKFQQFQKSQILAW